MLNGNFTAIKITNSTMEQNAGMKFLSRIFYRYFALLT